MRQEGSPFLGCANNLKKVFLNYFVGRGHSSEATALLTTATYLRETLPIK